MSDTPKVNLSINQGATFRHKFTWQDAKKRAINLTGYTARLQARESVESPAAVLDLSTENGGIVLGGTNGTVSLYIAPAQTNPLTQRKLVYDLELYAPNGDVVRLVEGNFTISPKITRPA